jgi:hypothetical protein
VNEREQERRKRSVGDDDDGGHSTAACQAVCDGIWLTWILSKPPAC